MHEPGKNVGPSPGAWEARLGSEQFSDTELDLLLAELKAPEELTPHAGFYARVMDRIESQRSKSIWSIFTEPLFGRRLVMASGLLMLILGAALFVPGSEFEDEMSAVGQPSVAFTMPADQDKDAVLMNLVTYQEQ